MLSLQKLLYGCGAGVTLLALGCNDYLTGQLSDPEGPIQVTRLTLYDAGSRDHAIFTDTSLPDCAPVESKQKDCSTVESQQEHICKICFLDTFKDTYSTKKSPPTTDSGQDIRVVFNKVPLLFDGTELANDYDPVADKSTTDPGKVNLAAAVKMTCATCGGLPPLSRFLVVSGSDVTFDPTTIPYGPSLRLAVDTTDPRAALEPDSTYNVQVDGRVAGRDGERLAQPDANLLSFKTEPFMVLSVGEGDAEKWVYGDKTPGMYTLADHPRDGAVALKLNAPAHVDSLAMAGVMATKQGGAPVMVKLGADAFGAKSNMVCPPHSQRVLYIYPDGGMPWPADASQVDIRIPGGAVADAAQGGMFEKGKHTIGNEITISVKFAAMPGGTGYTKITDAMKAGACQ
jgi:hypothetical protein